MRRISKPVLTLFGRPACHLCDDMLAVLEDMHGEYDFELDIKDVDADPEWQEHYGPLIPVLMLGAEEVCHYFVDMAKVREVLGRFR